MQCTECGAEGYGLHHSAACKYLNIDIYTKCDQLQAENEGLERKIRNMYQAIDEIQDDYSRMRAKDAVEAKQKEDARTVEPMFKTKTCTENENGN